LYSFLQPTAEKPSLELNGKSVPIELAKGYAVFKRAWQAGDKVTLSLPMTPQRVVANKQVVADRGRVALLRGPLVYCVEGLDVAGGQPRELVLTDDAPLETEFRGDLLGGVEVITGRGESLASKDKQPETGGVAFTAIPYYAWANRGKGEMAVWLARTPDVPKEE
jgi:DUF1680 family protein